MALDHSCRVQRHPFADREKAHAVATAGKARRRRARFRSLGSFGSAITAGVIQGALVKFTNDSEWMQDGEILPPELELVAVGIGRVVQKWKDGTPAETLVLQPGQKFPDIDALNASVPVAKWEEGPGGKRGPWQAQHIVYLLNEQTMDKYTYPTGTIGGRIAVSELRDRVCWMRQFRGAKVYPVVRLATKFMNTRYGGRERPHFDIQRWVALGDEGAALAPSSTTPSLPASEPQSHGKIVEPVSAKEATCDAIPY
jgi:hypothetical protein